MRLGETDGQEELAVFVPLQIFNRPSGRPVIAVRFSLPLQNHDAIRLRSATRGACIGGIRRASRAGEAARLASLGPRVSVIDPAVIDFAGAQRRIAARLEVLRQRDEIRMLRAKPGLVVHHAGLGRISSGEQRRARRVAKRILGVSPLEPHSARGQTVYVRRFDELIAVTTQLGPQVVRSDEEDVVCGLFRRRRTRRLRRSESQQTRADRAERD